MRTNGVAVAPRQRKLFDKLAEQFNIETQKDWYHVTARDVQLQVGDSQTLNGPLFTSLKSAYPEFYWNPLLFQRVPNHFWNLKETKRSILDEIADRFEVKKQQDWYNFSGEDVKSTIGGSRLLQQHNNSLFNTLQTVYSEFEWNSLSFGSNKAQRVELHAERKKKKKKWNSDLLEQVPKNSWSERSTQRKAFDWLAEELNVQNLEDWFAFTAEDVNRIAGLGLLEPYDGSLFNALRSVYPEFRWSPVLFPRVPNHYWNERATQRELFDWIADELQIQRQGDWYSFTAEDVKFIIGSRLIKQNFGDSLFFALEYVYPEFSWHPRLFSFRTPRGFWQHEEHQRLWFEWVGEQLDVNQLANLLSFPKDALKQKGGNSLISYHGNSLRRALEVVNPGSFDFSSSALRQSQEQLNTFHALNSILGEPMLSNFKFVGPHKQLVELDIYVPSLSLAVEYQSGIHYRSKNFHQGSLALRQQRDLDKISLCSQRGITLIQVPYWWKNLTESLLSTLAKSRPDICINL